MGKRRHLLIIVLVMVIFFTISFITNILNSIIVDVRNSFDLSLGLTGFLPFSFFIAYGVMSIPAGFLTEKFSDKFLLSISFLMIIASCTVFVLYPSYILFSLTLFFLGCSMAVLQVVINPMLRWAGGEEHFAFNSVLAQLVFGLASYLSPYLYIYLANNSNPDLIKRTLLGLVPEQLPWVSLYLVFAILSFLIFIFIRTLNYPMFRKESGEISGNKSTYISLLKNKNALLYFLGIFCYVGVEQGVGNWISEFLYQYHDKDPQTTGANIVAYFWAMLTIGCLLGLVLLKFIDSRKLLIGFTILTIISLFLSLFAPSSLTLYAFPMIGFFISVMWSIIFSLGLNSFKSHHGALSGILCTGIAGGAIMPLIVGIISDGIGLKFGMLFLLLPLAYILSIGFWAKPIIKNKTLNS